MGNQTKYNTDRREGTGQSAFLLYLPHWIWTLLLSMSKKEFGRKEGEREGGWRRQGGGENRRKA